MPLRSVPTLQDRTNSRQPAEFSSSRSLVIGKTHANFSAEANYVCAKQLRSRALQMRCPHRRRFIGGAAVAARSLGRELQAAKFHGKPKGNVLSA
jgi:hypothetical protein